MKALINFVAVFLFTFVLESCDSTDKLVHTVNCVVEKNRVVFEKELSVCLIIPEVGCGDCIAGGVYFLMENQNEFANTQKRNKVIFTAITSKKMLRRTLQIESIDLLNHELDTINRYLFPEELGLYPIVLYLNQGEILSVDIQSPDNAGALQRLQDNLNVIVDN